MDIRRFFIILIVLTSFLISAFVYNQLPSKVASHWDAAGNVNGYTTPFWGAYLVPLIMLGLSLLFLAIPYMDPLRKNIEQFRKHYETFIIVFLVFMLAIHVQTLLWNTDTRIPMNLTLPVGIGFLFFYIGHLFTHAKRNWFIGIRTPWTLSSDKVWNKTHELGAKLFKVAGIIAVLGVFFPSQSIWFILVPIMVASTVTIIYSYLEYRKH